MAEFHDEREWMPKEQRERYLVKGLRRIGQYAYERAPAMKKKFDDAGFDSSQFRSLKDLEKIAVTTRDEFIRMERAHPPFGGFLAIPFHHLKRVFIHPGPQYETMDDVDIEHATKVVYKLGVRKGDIVLNTLSYHLVPAGLLLDLTMLAIGATVVPSGVGNTDIQVQTAHVLKARGIIAFPSFFLTIIRRAEELGFDFRRDFAVRYGLMLGSPELRESIESYGIDTRELYAFLPVGLAACECDQKSGMHFEEDFIVEIVEPATGKQLGPGEAGEVVVTTIFNETLPRIRFGSGDLAYYTDEPCPCGRTADRIVKVVGRVGEGVKLRGMFIHPLEIADMASHIPEISQVQVRITRAGLKDVITAYFELAREDADREAVAERFGKDFQSRCRLRVDKAEFVPSGTIPTDAPKVVDERKEIVL